MTHTEYLKAIKEVVGKYCNNRFQPKPNTNIIVGMAESSSQLRYDKIQKIEEELRNLNMFKQVNIKNSITLGRKSNLNETVQHRSSAKLIVVEAGLQLPYVILLKPLSAGEQKLGPKDFNLTGNMQSLSEYIESVAYNVSTRKDIPDDITIFLENLTLDVSSGGFQKQGVNKFVKRASKTTQMFFNDASQTFYSNLNKQFGEVLAPFILTQDADLKNYTNMKIGFPTSETTSGKDFTIEVTNKNRERLKYNYSVKTGVTEAVNTVKPSDLINMMTGRTVPRELAEEYSILKLLNDNSAEEGVKQVAKKLGYSDPIEDEQESLQSAISFIEKASGEMKFRNLLAFAVEKKLTFIKFSYTKNHNIIFEIIKYNQISKLQQSDSKIFLRGKGFKEGKRMREKLGLTPP
jgi:hypothetical protein